MNAILLSELKKLLQRENATTEATSENELIKDDSKNSTSIDHESKEQFDADNDFRNEMSNVEDEDDINIISNIDQDNVNNEQITQESLFENETKETLSSEDDSRPECKQTKINSNKTTFHCSICNKGFRIYFHLKQHMRNDHENNTKYKTEDIHTVHEGHKDDKM